MEVPSNVRQRLLGTARADVPAADYESLRRFCEQTPQVGAGYVCRVERIEARQPEQSLRFAVGLIQPVLEPGDAVAESRAILSRLSKELPDLARSMGLVVLADRGAASWEAKGVRVFSQLG